ncbi:hypothetical protein D1818_07820 [Aquimarina sp. BL5]|uniref:tail fiber protein n=1 Tax=Aquimarina sp. BL5 TaxID=1714860 RepID=UPI000E4E8294|nr:tail fiber protein [Aquimarina sp. BL5]AXT50740.1 hypothetical protein D1818_07820 [Aquimarina sp. BL5]RKN08237.1 hypothetical protein D7036_06345 [Aquimarina sp. BL5]
MRKKLLLITILLFFIEGKSQNVDLKNSSDYIRVQKTGETGFSRAFGLNGSNQLYIGSIEKTIGNMYFFNKGTGHLMTLNPSGNLGIGTTNPGAKLDILSNTGQTESLMRFKISDAPSDYLQIANSTGSANQFIPLIKGYHQTDNRYSLSIMGSTSDAMDNGSNALINFNARRSNSVVQTRPLFVWTNYDQKMMTMSANGNLGIGTTNPSVALDVSGTSKGIKLGDSNGNLLFRNNVSGANEIRSYGLPLEIETRDIQDISFNSNNGNSKLMTIKGDGSGIGIGTTSPSAKLEIKGAGDGVEILKLSTERPWVFKQEGTGASSNLVLQEISGNKFFKIKSYDNTDIYTIQSNSGNTYFKGDMGIGTNTPDAKLAVNGNIHAKEVKVDLVGWPDYVFENDYNLPSLQQVENHIAEKGHLENIPSAAEVAENGLQLGEMNAKLLQKIEELTLYMIEQNKKTENLIKEVEALKQKNTELEKKIK